MISDWPQIAKEEMMALQEAQRAFPVKLSTLAQRLGVQVIASTLPVGISGEIRPSNGGFVVRVNRHDSQRRQRFTVAHEIAHYVLHRDQIGDGISDDVLYRSTLSDTREAEANRLAADILMPRDEVRRRLDAKGGVAAEDVVSHLAGHFGVSEAAMRIRLGIG